MKSIHEVPSDKLRGGFYTPPLMVDACYRRIAMLLAGRRRLKILEPSAGDGAFVRGLQRYMQVSHRKALDITCVELDEVECQKCNAVLSESSVTGCVINDSFFSWAREAPTSYDVVVGNPPFVRYQFLPKDERDLASLLMDRRGITLDGVSNLWIPFVLASLQLLRPGGVFALVLPYELFTTKSARFIRSEFVRHFESLRVEIYPRDSFPDLLQDVVVASGRRAKTAKMSRPIIFCESRLAEKREWRCEVNNPGQAWTQYLLPNEEREAFSDVSTLAGFRPLSDIATIGVSIVTGANGFFTVSDRTLEEFNLQAWARPLLGRTVDSPGIVFSGRDHSNARANGKRAWLLDFGAGKPDPIRYAKSGRYIESGVAKGLPGRYKCRIRVPWYRVPDIRQGSLMLSKRSHQFHRLIFNQGEAFTTDTIYRGEMKRGYKGQVKDLVAGFHSSATLLSAELEGRSYGGGVLELIPSEVSRLVVPLLPLKQYLRHLDEVSRDAGGQLDKYDRLVHATDALIVKSLPEYAELLPKLDSGRCRLRKRRFHG